MLDERWSEDAAELSSGLRALLERESSRQRVRAAEEAADGRDPLLEKALTEFGLWELPADPELLSVAAYELGRSLAPIPFPELTPARVVLGLDDTAYGLEGPVPAAATDAVVGPPSRPRLVAVEGRRRRTAAGDYLVVAEAVSGEAAGTANDAATMSRLIRMLDAARLIGVGQALLKIGVDYALERHAFGRPIGGFQSVAHRLVNAAIALDGAELTLRKVAYFADADRGGDGAPAMVHARIVRGLAIDAARLCATNVHQVMGGYGFTLEYDCQLFSRRIRSWALRLAPLNAEYAAIAKAVLDPTERDGIEHLWSYDRGMPLPRWAAEIDSAPAARNDGMTGG